MDTFGQDDIGALSLVLAFHQAYILIWETRIFGSLPCCLVPHPKPLSDRLSSWPEFDRKECLHYSASTGAQGGRKVELRARSEAFNRTTSSDDSQNACRGGCRGQRHSLIPTDHCTNQLPSVRNSDWQCISTVYPLLPCGMSMGSPFFLLSRQVSFTSARRTFLIGTCTWVYTAHLSRFARPGGYVSDSYLSMVSHFCLSMDRTIRAPRVLDLWITVLPKPAQNDVEQDVRKHDG
jgi:hypothetical protein